MIREPRALGLLMILVVATGFGCQRRGAQPTPEVTQEAMPETIRWYDEHGEWLERVRSGAYRDYYERQYGARLET